MKKLFETPHGTIYGKRTVAGGIAYYDDTCSALIQLVDMTVANRQHLKIILDNHDEIEKYFDKIPECE